MPTYTQGIETSIGQPLVASNISQHSQIFANLREQPTPSTETIGKRPLIPINSETRNELNNALTTAFEQDPKFKSNFIELLKRPRYKKGFGPFFRDEEVAGNIIEWLNSGAFQKRINNIMTPDEPMDVIDKLFGK